METKFESLFRYASISLCHSLLRMVILGKVFGWYFLSGRYTLFRRSGDFTRNWSKNLLFLSIFSISLSFSLYASPFHFISISMPLTFTILLSIPLPFTSLTLSLLSIFLSGVSNGGFHSCLFIICFQHLKRNFEDLAVTWTPKFA